MEAMKSLAEQSLDRNDFEVVVVKNYSDGDIDDYAASQGYRLINTQATTVGSKMAIGMRESTADIVSFLEDDDIFEPDKLKLISQYFADKEELGFIHNSYTIVDEDGKFYAKDPRGDRLVELNFTGSFVSSCSQSHLKFTDLGYCSCLSLRKELVENDLKQLESIMSSPDFFLLFSLINAGARGYRIPEKLTRYRLHTSHSNRIGSFDEFMAGNVEIRERWVKDYLLMRDCFHSPQVEELAAFFINYNRLFALSLRPERSMLRKTLPTLQLMMSPRIFSLYEGWFITLFSALSIFSPHGAHKFYFAYRMSKYFTGTERN